MRLYAAAAGEATAVNLTRVHLRKLAPVVKGFSVLALFGAGLVLPSPAHPDCVTQLTGEVICGTGSCNTDLYGEASCAQYRFGTGVRTHCDDAAPRGSALPRPHYLPVLRAGGLRPRWSAAEADA
jgi:hypothetical protein